MSFQHQYAQNTDAFRNLIYFAHIITTENNFESPLKRSKHRKFLYAGNKRS